MSKGLAQLPVDLLAPIVTLLDAEDVLALWKTGDRRLQLPMSHGAVQAIELKHLRKWPGFVRHFRLKRLTLLSTSGAMHNNEMIYVEGVDWTTLNATIEELDLRFLNALSRLLLLPPGVHLASLVPNLKKLYFSYQYIPQFSRLEFIQQLPQSLTTLHLPSNVGFGADSILALPSSLTELFITAHPIQEGDEDRIRQSPAFARLSSLSISLMADDLWPTLLPASLTNCHILEISSSLTRNGSYLDYVRSKRSSHANSLPKPSKLPYVLTVDDMSLLPRNLTCLEIPWHHTMTIELVRELPASLTELECYGLFGWESRLDPALCLKALPLRLTHLSTEMANLPISLTPLFPPNLTSWASLMLIVAYDSDDESTYDISFEDCQKRMKYDGLELPKSMREVCLDRADVGVLKLLPPSVTFLQVDLLARFDTAAWMQLPSQLVYLMLELDELDAACLLHLPPQLTSLRLSAPKMTNTASIVTEWHRIWPKRMKSISLTVSYDEEEALGPSFWPSFPSTVANLSIYLHHFDCLPENMACFPRTLESLTLSCRAVIKPVHDCRVTDSFFAHLPRSILVARFVGLDYQVTPNVLKLLPAGIIKFELEMMPSLNYKIHPSPLDCGLVGNDQLWDFLDQIPRHLTYSVVPLLPGYAKTKSPDFTSVLLECQFDDLCEAHPNVAFDDFAVGAGRPFWTPRRPNA